MYVKLRYLDSSYYFTKGYELRVIQAVEIVI
jgi:hypothetical protein